MGYVAFAAETSDREALARLWAENMSDRQIALALDRRMRWLYEDQRATGVRTWLVKKDDTGEVVGCASVCPRTLHVDGRDVRAGLLSDFAIARAHRVAGPAITLQRALVADSAGLGMELLFGHPNRGAVPIFRRVGYEQVGDITTWTKPLRSAERLRAYLSPLLADTAALAVDRLLAANDLRLRLAHGGWFREQELDRADNRFDALWERGKTDKPATIERTAEYLNWRYADFTTAQFRIFAISDRRGRRLRGYVVWRADRGAALASDVFWDGGDRVLRALLVRFACRMRRRGLQSVHLIVLGDASLAPCLRSSHFFPATPDPRPVIVHVSTSAPQHLRMLLGAPSRWLLFDGDLDL